MEKSLKLATPPAPDLAYLRSSLIPGMLEAVAKNLRYYDEFRLFDCEEVYEKVIIGHLQKMKSYQFKRII